MTVWSTKDAFRSTSVTTRMAKRECRADVNDLRLEIGSLGVGQLLRMFPKRKHTNSGSATGSTNTAISYVPGNNLIE
jgi:hypothetical protein